MARSEAVWGVDIGNAALKAIRCRPAEDPEQIEAIAFDYIEYPKLLTQPGADPTKWAGEVHQVAAGRDQADSTDCPL